MHARAFSQSRGCGEKAVRCRQYPAFRDGRVNSRSR